MMASMQKSNSAYWRTRTEITQNNKIPFDVALFSLTNLERAVLNILRLGNYQFHESSDVFSEHANKLLTVYRTDYRVGIKKLEHTIPSNENVLFFVNLTENDWNIISAINLYHDYCLDSKLYVIDSYFQSLHEGDSLRNLVGSVWEALFHMPPIAMFVGDQLYTSESTWHNNLTIRQKGKSIFDSLIDLPPANWKKEDKQFVFAFHILFQVAGGAYRLAEMNWMQVDPITLETYLSQKIKEYSSLIMNPLIDDTVSLSISEKAEYLKKLHELASKDFQYFISINGPSFNKQVKYFPHTKIAFNKFPDNIFISLTNLFPNCRYDGQWKSFLYRLTIEAVHNNMVKDLILTFVKSGLDATNADFFMFRGPCNLSIPEEYNQLKKNNFFCVVLAKVGYDPTDFGFLKYSTEEIRWNQSLRMQFNSWKFWYGNLKEEERSPGQYWFYPPKLPDIAFDDHLIHGGHRENGVVQAIRSPGELVLTNFVSKERRTFVAAYDTRSARSSSEPNYGENDILATIQHRIWLGEIIQSLADYGAARNSPIYIQFFDRGFHIEQS